SRRPIFGLVPLGLFFLLQLHAQEPAAPTSGSAASGGTSNQQRSEPAPQSSAPVGSANGSSPNEEVSSRDTPPTFKVRVNLVLVRVVVRDPQGNVVPNLKKEDFQLFDNRKPQVISSFTAETPESHAVTPATTPASTSDSS